MAYLKINEADLQPIWSYLSTNPTCRPANPVKWMFIHSPLEDSKISPPFILTCHNELFHATYTHDDPQKRDSIKQYNQLCRADIISIAYGTDHGMFLTRDGQVYSFGSNAEGDRKSVV